MVKYYEYETIQGDTFDMIALDFYNDEAKASTIIQANPECCNVLVFDAGVVLKIPQIEETASTTLPPWKR
ncbi:MAG: LysM protein [Clostridia bacterium]|nr:LysM protein [Clostridia bacterium]